jgi:hypothetical protein
VTPYRSHAVALAFTCGLLTSCGMLSEPQDVDVVVEAPTSVEHGERFTIRARIRNTAPHPQHLVDLDVADEYLAGIAIEKTEPPFKQAMHVPVDDTVSYHFELEVPSGEERVVLLHAYAAHPGDWAGDFDFCVNSAYQFVSTRARTIVR